MCRTHLINQFILYHPLATLQEKHPKSTNFKIKQKLQIVKVVALWSIKDDKSSKATRSEFLHLKFSTFGDKHKT